MGNNPSLPQINLPNSFPNPFAEQQSQPQQQQQQEQEQEEQEQLQQQHHQDHQDQEYQQQQHQQYQQPETPVKKKKKKKLDKKNEFKFEILLLGLEMAGKTTLLEQITAEDSFSSANTIPAVGSAVSVIKYRPKHQWLNKEYKKPRNSIKIRAWDLSKDKATPDWSKYLQKGVHGLIWVIDSTEKKKLAWRNDGSWRGTVKHELYESLANPALDNVPLLIFANKQDLPNALVPKEIAHRLDLTPGSKMRWTEFVEDCGFDKYVDDNDVLLCIYNYLPGLAGIHPNGLASSREVHIEGCCATNGDGLWEGLVWLEEAILRCEQAKSPQESNDPQS